MRSATKPTGTFWLGCIGDLGACALLRCSGVWYAEPPSEGGCVAMQCPTNSASASRSKYGSASTWCAGLKRGPIGRHKLGSVASRGVAMPGKAGLYAIASPDATG